MREPTPQTGMPHPDTGPGVEDYRHWKPEYQQKALDLLEERKRNPWKPFYCPKHGCDGNPHGEWKWQHARQDQHPPKWWTSWLVWLLAGGRGSGKTRTGAEVTHRVTDLTPRIILIAPTGPDFRETMVEGVSGILATAKPDKRPFWEPSKKKLTWPNGCVAQGFSAEEPDRLRGPQSGFVWADEPAHYPDIEDVWDNMLFGLRIGRAPKVVATTTPKPNSWMKRLVEDTSTVLHKVSTYANIVNLADTFKQIVLDRYEGTRIGQQELHGEILKDVEGALWNWDMIRSAAEPPALTRIVVSVDPAGSTSPKADLTGIIVIGISADKDLYVLADYSGRYRPGEWADKAVAAFEDFSADAIVAEKNYGGEMVKHTLENSRVAKRVDPRIVLVESRRGKQIRAEPIVALYEKKRVYHAGQRGDLSDLEDEQTSWVPGEGDSPNRVDALVHGATDLAKSIMPAAVADPRKLLADRQAPTNRHLRAVS